MIILSQFEAQAVIDNVETAINIGFMTGSYISRKNGGSSSSGLEDYFKDYIRDQINEYGVIAVGSALKFVESSFDFSRPDLYYPTKEGTAKDLFQEAERDRFVTSLDTFLQDALAMLQDENEELSEDLTERYNRLRRNALDRRRYWRNKGVEVEALPDIVEVGKRSFLDYQKLMDYLERTR